MHSKVQIQHNGIKIGANVCKGRRRLAGRWNVKKSSDGGCGCVCLRRRRGTNGTESVLNVVDETEECVNYAPTAVSSARELSSGVSNHTTTRIRIQTAGLAFGGTGLCSCVGGVDGSCA